MLGVVDESINSYESDEYQAITGTQLNNAGQITITTENQDQFLQLHNSYLLIEGDVLKADSTRYADADPIALTNNGVMYLFSGLKLTLTGQLVEQCQLSWSDYITSRFGNLLTRLFKRHRAGLQTLMLMQPLLIPDLQYVNTS